MEMQITWDRASRVWTAIAWRMMLAVFVIVLVVLVALGFLLNSLGISGSTIDVILKAAGLILMLITSIWIIKSVLGRNYGDFRLVLISQDSNANGKK